MPTCYRLWNLQKIRCSLSLFSVKNAKIVQLWVWPKFLTLISTADWSDKSEWYCWMVHCFQNIWFSKRTHPKEHQNAYWLSTKWVLASDQLSVLLWLVQPIKELSSVAGLCAGRDSALIRQLANWFAFLWPCFIKHLQRSAGGRSWMSVFDQFTCNDARQDNVFTHDGVIDQMRSGHNDRELSALTCFTWSSSPI